MTAYKLGILWLWYIGGGWVGQKVEKIRVGVALALGWPVLSVACSRTIIEQAPGIPTVGIKHPRGCNDVTHGGKIL